MPLYTRFELSQLVFQEGGRGGKGRTRSSRKAGKGLSKVYEVTPPSCRPLEMDFALPTSAKLPSALHQPKPLHSFHAVPPPSLLAPADRQIFDGPGHTAATTMLAATTTQSTTMQAAITTQREEPSDEDPFGFNEEPPVCSVPLPITISSSSSSAALGNTSSSSLQAKPQSPPAIS